MTNTNKNPDTTEMENLLNEDYKETMQGRTIKRTNPFSGQSELLTKEEAKLYDQIKLDEYLENYNLVQKGLSLFSRMNAKAYMTLLD